MTNRPMLEPIYGLTNKLVNKPISGSTNGVMHGPYELTNDQEADAPIKQWCDEWAHLWVN